MIHYVFEISYFILSGVFDVFQNNLEELQSLIDKWRTVAQEALYHLMDLNRESGVSLTDLVNYFSLDHKLLGFNVDDESFT